MLRKVSLRSSPTTRRASLYSMMIPMKTKSAVSLTGSQILTKTLVMAADLTSLVAMLMVGHKNSEETKAKGVTLRDHRPTTEATTRGSIRGVKTKRVSIKVTIVSLGRMAKTKELAFQETGMLKARPTIGKIELSLIITSLKRETTMLLSLIATTTRRTIILTINLRITMVRNLRIEQVQIGSEISIAIVQEISSLQPIISMLDRTKTNETTLEMAQENQLMATAIRETMATTIRRMPTGEVIALETTATIRVSPRAVSYLTGFLASQPFKTIRRDWRNGTRWLSQLEGRNLWSVPSTSTKNFPYLIKSSQSFFFSKTSYELTVACRLF